MERLKHPIEYELHPGNIYLSIVSAGTRWLTLSLKNVGSEKLADLDLRVNSLDTRCINVLMPVSCIPVLKPGEERMLHFQVLASATSEICAALDGWRDGEPFHWESPGMPVRVDPQPAELVSVCAFVQPHSVLGKRAVCEAVLRGLDRSDGLKLEFWAESPSGKTGELATLRTGALSVGEEARYTVEILLEEEGMHRIHAYLYDGARRLGHQVTRVSAGRVAKLKFLGTRGNTDARTHHHHLHSSMMVSYGDSNIMIDCGEDWLGKVGSLSPQVIVITHAHPDHSWGLKEGAPCPVYATEESWEGMEDFAIQDRRVVAPRQPVDIEGVTFEAFPVDHSTRAPAVGYRITAGRTAIFYVPDVVWIHDREDALSGVGLYIGDGATITRSLVRKSGGVLIGHTPIRTQLTWCQKEGVPRAIFTHFGAELIEGDEEALEARIQVLAQERGVEVEIARDGMEMTLV